MGSLNHVIRASRIPVKPKRKLLRIVNALNVGHCATLMLARKVGILVTSLKSEKKHVHEMAKVDCFRE